jgi:hypothetical protein
MLIEPFCEREPDGARSHSSAVVASRWMPTQDVCSRKHEVNDSASQPARGRVVILRLPPDSDLSFAPLRH